jgi:peptide/nickel transport system permease protein
MTTDSPPANAPLDLSAFGSGATYKIRGFWTNALLHLWHDHLTMAALMVLAILTVLCFLGPPIIEATTDIDATSTNIREQSLMSPSSEHLLGTDKLGRDVFIRLLYGGQVSLGIAYLASTMSITIGVVIGLVAGYYGGLIDDIIIWFITTIVSIPSIFLLLILSAVFEPSPWILVLIFGLLGWMGASRLVRGEVFSVKSRDYVVAAQAVGARTWHLMFFHIFPNVLSIVIILMAIDAGTLILSETALSFLGLGVRPPDPSWGNILTDAQKYYTTAPHLIIIPGIAITITVLCFYLVGDGLRDALDPRSERVR